MSEEYHDRTRRQRIGGIRAAACGMQIPNPRVCITSMERVFDAAADARRRLLRAEGIGRHPAPLTMVAVKAVKRCQRRGGLGGCHVAAFTAFVVEILAHDPVVHAFLESIGLPSPAVQRREVSR
jgi:hypothetical protein